MIRHTVSLAVSLAVSFSVFLSLPPSRLAIKLFCLSVSVSFSHFLCLALLIEATKKSFFSGPSTNALTPPPLEHSGHRYFIVVKNKVNKIFVVARLLNFFCGFPNLSLFLRRGAVARCPKYSHPALNVEPTSPPPLPYLHPLPLSSIPPFLLPRPHPHPPPHPSPPPTDGPMKMQENIHFSTKFTVQFL